MAPQEPDARPVFVGREKIIDHIFDYLHGDGRVVIVHGQHWAGKSFLLRHINQLLIDQPSSLIPGLATVEKINEALFPWLRAADALLTNLEKRGLKKTLPSKTADFLKSVFSGKSLQKVAAAGSADSGGQAGMGGLGKTTYGLFSEGLTTASPRLGVKGAMSAIQPPLVDIFLPHLKAIAGVIPDDEKAVLFIDQVERGGKDFTKLIQDLLIDLPKNVCLIMGVNVGMVQGADFLRDLDESLTDIEAERIALPGLEVHEIGELFREDKKVAFDRTFLRQVTEVSGGLPGLIVQWMETPDFEARDLEGLQKAKIRKYGYYRTMIEQLDPEARDVAQICCLIDNHPPDGRRDLARLYNQNVTWVVNIERRLLRAQVFTEYPDKAMAWFAHELLQEFIREDWCVKEINEDNATRLRHFIQNKYGTLISANDDPRLFADYAELVRLTGSPEEIWWVYTELSDHYYRTSDYGLAEEAAKIAEEAAEREVNQNG